MDGKKLSGVCGAHCEPVDCLRRGSLAFGFPIAIARPVVRRRVPPAGSVGDRPFAAISASEAGFPRLSCG
jgi:hypothetical protein